MEFLNARHRLFSAKHRSLNGRTSVEAYLQASLGVAVKPLIPIFLKPIPLGPAQAVVSQAPSDLQLVEPYSCWCFLQAQQFLGSLGSETDGSIISPSSRNNLVGIKPTVGLTSRAGGRYHRLFLIELR